LGLYVIYRDGTEWFKERYVHSHICFILYQFLRGVIYVHLLVKIVETLL